MNESAWLGAEQSMVRAELVDKSAYVKENVRVEGFDGEAKIIPLAKVWIILGTSDFSKCTLCISVRASF